MDIRSLYYAVCIVGYLIAGFIFFSAIRNNNKMRVRKRPLEMVRDFMVKDIDIHHVNELIKKTGLKANLMQYQICRYVLCMGVSFMHIAGSIAKGQPLSSMLLVFMVIVFFATAPDLKIVKFKSPFEYLIDALIRSNQQKYNLELYRANSQLKNLAITKANNPPGAVFILEQLKKFTNKTKPIFEQMQSLWEMGQKDKACEYFASAIGTDEAKSFSAILRKIDNMNPFELKQEMALFQEVIRTKRETERIKLNQNKSHFIYLVVVMAFMTIFVNWLVVSVFIDMLKDLRGM